MIRISNLNFSYRKKGPLFRNLNLSLSPGNIYGLLGKNGAGKTTLLKIISGLIYPLTGECLVNKEKPGRRNPEQLQDIFFLPETGFLPPVKMNDYLMILSPFYPHFDKNKFLQYLEAFEIASEGKITDLSYGQRKKVSIAFALAANSRVLLLDEPTNGLDIPAKSVFRKLVASSIDDDKLFIISTHQVRDMKNLIDPIIILDNGKIIFNQQITEFSDKISLSFQSEKPKENESGVLYYENTLGGYAVLTDKNDEDENEVDIELLFNAIVSNDKKVLNHINMEEVR